MWFLRVLYFEIQDVHFIQTFTVVQPERENYFESFMFEVCVSVVCVE